MNLNTNIFQYLNDKLCVIGSGIIKSDGNPSGIINLELWKKWAKNGSNLVQRGGNGRQSLIEFETIPQKWKDIIVATYGDPKREAISTPFKDRIIPDSKAIEYYANYMLGDGRFLKPEVQREYAMNAAVLNAIHDMYTKMSIARQALGGNMRNFWQKASMACESIKQDIGHTLSLNHIVLKRQYDSYRKNGYEGLISGKYCNQNTRKVSNDLEKLLLALYTMPNRPFAADVHDMYTQFREGKIQVVDSSTGEMFDPEHYKKAGFPVEISKTTVWNYLNQPQNRAIVDKKRNDQHTFNTMHRPFHRRRSPNYSFSKITMDDRDLPRKLTDGKRVKAYYAYDVASGCVIGAAYSRSKDEELFLDCLRDMLRMIDRNNWGIPMEVEVEHHLVNKFADDLAVMFPIVTFCNPGNSQQKRAEHLNRTKKYEVERKHHRNIGRWWAKHEAYLVKTSKVNDDFKESVYSYETLTADDLNDIKTFNNNPHPNQKKYPGKTRWQVLCENMNPNTAKPSKALWYKCIGYKTETSILRNQAVRVQYEDYVLPSPAIIDRLIPNDYTVDAYWMPNEEGSISEVYLYQRGEFICTCKKLVRYNEAKAEETPQDVEARLEQSKYVAQFDKLTKDGRDELADVVIINPEKVEAMVEDSKYVEIIETPDLSDDDDGLLSDEEFEAELARVKEKFSEEKMVEQARENL